MVQPLRELIVYRHVVLALVWRDLKARYRGSVFGFLWTFLNPLLLMAIYSLVFAVYMRVQIRAYPAFVFAGLLPWTWFASATLRGSNALVEGGDLMKKVFFPPQILPTVVVISTLVNFLLSVPLLLGFALATGVGLHWTLLLLPLPIAIQVILTLALAIGGSVLTVRYRDVYHLLANFMALWFFLTPVLCPDTWGADQLRPLRFLNPMGPLTMTYQDLLYHHRLPDPAALGSVVLVSLALLAGSLWVLERWRWVLVEDV